MKVQFKKLHEDAVLPKYAKSGDAGMDLTCVDYEYDEKQDVYVYHTGLATSVPNGHVMLLFPRSSNAKTEFYLTNHVGVVDSGYRGEIMLKFKSRDKENPNDAPYGIGDRICQCIIMPYPFIEPELAEELSETERGTGGFGSSGK